MNKWIDNQFAEALMMFKFLQQRKSTIPDKLNRNSWGIFTNKYNLDKY